VPPVQSALVGNTASLAFPSNVALGNAIVVLVASEAEPSSVTDTRGNTYTKLTGSGVSDVELSVWIADGGSGGANTVTINGASFVYALGIAELSGAHSAGAATPVVHTSGSSSAFTSGTPSITPTADGAMFLGLCADLTGNATDVTPASPWTELHGTAHEMLAYYEQPTAAARVFSGTINQYFCAVQVALLPAGPAATFEQHSFRFFNNDGSESASTPAAALNVGIACPIGEVKRLRILAAASGDVPSLQARLDYRKVGDSTLVPVLVSPPSAPTVQAIGTEVSGTGNVTPTWPTHQAGDIGLLVIESTGGQAAALGTANGFTSVDVANTGSGTAGTRITAYWCRATSSSMAAPIVTDPGDHCYARIILIRGCVAEGTPFEGVQTAVKASASTSASAPATTTLGPNRLVLGIIARDNDSASAAFSSWANSDLSSVAEQADSGTTSGNGGGIGVASGVRASAGAVGAWSATVTSSINASLTIAFRPQPTPILMAASAYIAPSGEDTTARMTAPSGKSFGGGRAQDDENPADAVDLDDDYGEWEYSLGPTSDAVNTEEYEFYLTANGVPFAVYTEIPVLEVGSDVVALTPAAAVVDVVGVSPSLLAASAASLLPAAAAVSVVAQTPIVAAGAISLAVSAAVVTVDAVTPALVPGAIALTPSAATVTVSGHDPTLSSSGAIALTVGAASITVAAIDPTLVPGARTLTPLVAVVEVVALDPTIAGGAGGLTPLAAVVTVTAIAPALVATATVALTPGAAVITVVAIDPALAASSTALLPAAAVVDVAAIDPTLAQDAPPQTLTPGPANITVVAPGAGISASSLALMIDPASVTVTAASPTPSVSGVALLTPPAAVVTVTGQTPGVIGTGSIALTLSPASVTVVALSPTIPVIGTTLMPGAAVCTVTAPALHLVVSGTAAISIATAAVTVTALAPFVALGAQLVLHAVDVSIPRWWLQDASVPTLHLEDQSLTPYHLQDRS